MENFLENIHIVFSALALLFGLWASFQKQIKRLFRFSFNLKHAELSIQEKYEKYRDEQLEKMLKTMNSYRQANEKLEVQVKDLMQLVKKRDIAIAALKQQVVEQKHIIENYQDMIEGDQDYLKKMKQAMKKYEIHIRYLEKLLRKNNVEFKELEI